MFWGVRIHKLFLDTPFQTTNILLLQKIPLVGVVQVKRELGVELNQIPQTAQSRVLQETFKPSRVTVMSRYRGIHLYQMEDLQ